jgi:hypothetical protein
LGPVRLSRWRARGIRMSTFLCSLRPGPAAAGWFGPAGRLGEAEAFGVPQRGTAYQPGVKPRVWRTTGAFGRNAAYTRVLSPVLRWPSAGAGAWGLMAVGAPRDRSCARRERWGQLGFRAGARRGSGCRRSYARSGPVPLPLGGSVLQEGSGKVRRSECPNGAPHTSPG